MRFKQIACTFLTVVIAAVSFAVPVSAASKPAAPAGITATAKSSSSVRVEWKAVTGAAKYTVFYSADNKTYKSYSTVRTRYATVKGLSAGTKYYFRVKSLDASGEKSAYSYLCITLYRHTVVGINIVLIIFLCRIWIRCIYCVFQFKAPACAVIQRIKPVLDIPA